MAQDAPKRRFLSLIFLVSCISKSIIIIMIIIIIITIAIVIFIYLFMFILFLSLLLRIHGFSFAQLLFIVNNDHFLSQ